MRRFKSEFVHTYRTYSFGYCEYAELAESEDPSDAYKGGFLPYSGSPDIERTLYMARSARVDLAHFEPSSENRRIARKFDGTLTREVISIKDFDYNDSEFLDFCLTYFGQRHGEDAMPKERLLTILSAGFPLSIIVYKNTDGVRVGYVFEITGEEMGHYWYSFYDLSYAYQSLGLWMMLDCIREAKTLGKRHYYLGTVYGEKALYKTNFPALEYWNGDAWIGDRTKLRELSKNDVHLGVDAIDAWKKDRGIF